MAPISGRMTYSSFYVTAFPIGPLLGVLSNSIRGEEVGSWEKLHLYHEESVDSSIWWSRRSGKEAKKASGIRGTRAPRRRIDRHSLVDWLLSLVPLGYSGEGLTGRSWAWIRGTRAPWRRIDRVFRGWLAFGPSPFGVPGWRIDRAFLGRLAFGPNPFGVLGLGRLARGTELVPMVPTMPPFSRRGGRSSPVRKKKKTSLTVIL